VLDAMLFGPVGLLLAVRDRYPELAEQGRIELDKQVRTARMIGTFAVSAAQKELAKRFAAPAPAATPDAARGSSRSVASASAALAPSKETVPRTSKAPATRARQRSKQAVAAVATADLPIAGYETLTAAQVIQHLASCSAAERLAVEEYERAHRKRQTILGRIEQLRG
jgi:hypothetical protein